MCVWGGLTCQRQETQTPHGQEVLQPEVLHLGGKAGRVNYFRSRPEGAPLLGSGHRGQGVGSKRGFSVPHGVGEALRTLCALLTSAAWVWRDPRLHYRI